MRTLASGGGKRGPARWNRWRAPRCFASLPHLGRAPRRPCRCREQPPLGGLSPPGNPLTLGPEVVPFARTAKRRLCPSAQLARDFLRRRNRFDSLRPGAVALSVGGNAALSAQALTPQCLANSLWAVAKFGWPGLAFGKADFVTGCMRFMELIRAALRQCGWRCAY